MNSRKTVSKSIVQSLPLQYHVEPSGAQHQTQVMRLSEALKKTVFNYFLVLVCVTVLR